jgi:hypothetical protein
MKTVSEIDQELAKLQQTIAGLEADRQKNVALLETARQAREHNALSALSTNDAKAQGALQKARAAQREIELLLEDLSSAEGEAQRQAERLRTERAEVFKHERWQEFQKVGERALGQAQILAGVAASLGELLLEHADALRQMTELAGESGHPTTSFRLAHFRRFLDASLHRILPHEFSNQPGIYRTGVYLDFLQEQINGLGNRAEPQNEGEKASA